MVVEAERPARSGSRSSAGCCGAPSTTSRRSTASTLTVRAGQTARRRRRERLGQDHARPGAAAADLVAKGRSRFDGQRHPGLALRASCGRCAARCRSSSRTPTARCQPAHVGRPDRRRRAGRARARAGAATSASMVAEALDEVGLDPAMPRPLPARVLRRPAPAHRDRPRHGAEAASSSCSTSRPRRSTCRCRRRSSTCCATCSAGTRPRLSVHQPRPEGGPRAGQRGDRDAQRQGGRAGRGRGDLRRAEADYTRALMEAAFGTPGGDRARGLP